MKDFETPNLKGYEPFDTDIPRVIMCKRCGKVIGEVIKGDVPETYCDDCFKTTKYVIFPWLEKE